LKWSLRKINNETIAHFQRLLSNETWESVFKNWDTNSKFNSFLDMFLKSFGPSFPIENKSLRKRRNNWITQRIKISSGHKSSLFSTEEVIIHT
jgi:hypothetical protein